MLIKHNPIKTYFFCIKIFLKPLIIQSTPLDRVKKLVGKNEIITTCLYRFRFWIRRHRLFSKVHQEHFIYLSCKAKLTNNYNKLNIQFLIIEGPADCYFNLIHTDQKYTMLVASPLNANSLTVRQRNEHVNATQKVNYLSGGSSECILKTNTKRILLIKSPV